MNSQSDKTSHSGYDEQPSLREQLSKLEFNLTGVETDGYHKYYTFKSTELDKVLALFQQFGEEVIGEDEGIDVPANPTNAELFADMGQFMRDELRAKQRQRLAALIGCEEKLQQETEGQG